MVTAEKSETTLFRLFSELSKAAQHGNDGVARELTTRISDTLNSLSKRHRTALSSHVELIQEGLASEPAESALADIMQAWKYARDHDL